MSRSFSKIPLRKREGGQLPALQDMRMTESRQLFHVVQLRRKPENAYFSETLEITEARTI